MKVILLETAREPEALTRAREEARESARRKFESESPEQLRQEALELLRGKRKASSSTSGTEES